MDSPPPPQPQPAQKLPPMQPLQRPESPPGLGNRLRNNDAAGHPCSWPSAPPRNLTPSPFPNFSPACYPQSHRVISPHTSWNQIGTRKQQLPRFLTSQVSTPFIPCLYVYLFVHLLLMYRHRHSPFSARDQSLPIWYVSRSITLEKTSQLCCVPLLHVFNFSLGSHSHKYSIFKNAQFILSTCLLPSPLRTLENLLN